MFVIGFMITLGARLYLSFFLSTAATSERDRGSCIEACLSCNTRYFHQTLPPGASEPIWSDAGNNSVKTHCRRCLNGSDMACSELPSLGFDLGLTGDLTDNVGGGAGVCWAFPVCSSIDLEQHRRRD